MSMDKMTELGPGKFSYAVDEAAYELTLHGFHDDECGEVDTCGWFARIIGPITKETLDSIDYLGAPLLNQADWGYLNAAGFIIDVDSQGFVEVQSYQSETLLDVEWSKCMKK